MTRRAVRCRVLFVVVLVITLTSLSSRMAAQTKKAKSTKAKDAAAEEAPKLPEVGFDLAADALTSPTAILEDKDATPEGRQRIGEIEGRAREIFRERDAIDRERRPIALKRDPLLVLYNQAQEAIRQATLAIGQLDQQAAQIQRRIGITNGDMKAQLQNQLAAIRGQAQILNQEIAYNNAGIQRISPDLTALNLQIAPFDQRLAKLWAELNEARKQWLELRQPVEKYSRGEFELLRRVLDDWLLIDGLWPAAFSWAALCAYEMDDLEKAAEYIEKAQALRTGVFESKKPWPHLEALGGMIGFKRPGQSGKAQTAIQKALTLVDKKNDWLTYFLVGRCYVDREREMSRAKANFDKALKIKPDCLCAKLWLARVQTTAPQEGLRDVPAGTKGLEYLWEKTGKRSWRLGYFLVEAYIAGAQTAKAAMLWETVLPMAPADQRDQLQLRRKKALEKTS